MVTYMCEPLSYPILSCPVRTLPFPSSPNLVSFDSALQGDIGKRIYNTFTVADHKMF